MLRQRRRLRGRAQRAQLQLQRRYCRGRVFADPNLSVNPIVELARFVIARRRRTLNLEPVDFERRLLSQRLLRLHARSGRLESDAVVFDHLDGQTLVQRDGNAVRGFR